MPKITTDARTINDDESNVDVEREACYDGEWAREVWKRRVWLDRETNEIETGEDILYSKDSVAPFEEIDPESVPDEIKSALCGRIDAAKDEILAPRMK